MAMSKDLAARIAASPDADAIERARVQMASSRRVASGRHLQDELEDTHKVMAFRGWGSVYPHARETVGTPLTTASGERGRGLRYKKGGNPVDYTGFVNLQQDAQGVWAHAVWRPRDPWPAPGAPVPRAVVRVPVVFDAKRLTKGLQYTHDHELVHQVLQLKDAAKNGAAAFLFVHHVALARGFLIGPHHLDTLIMGRPVRLVEEKSHQALHPTCEYRNGLGWAYGPQVPAACLDLFVQTTTAER